LSSVTPRLRRQLVEPAWAYRSGPSLRHRQDGVSPEAAARARATQVDLCGSSSLDKRKSARGVVVAAVARRLVAHLWEMVAVVGETLGRPERDLRRDVSHSAGHRGHEDRRQWGLGCGGT
jgi:hypothetical protein